MQFHLSDYWEAILNIRIRKLLTDFLFMLCASVTVVTTMNVNAGPLEVGRKAPDFTLRKIDGSSFKLSHFKGKRSVYLVFWNTWCGHCIKKVPNLKTIEREFGEQVELLAINTSWSDSLAAVAQFESRFSTNYAMAFDDDAKVTHRYGVVGTPTSFLVDINGEIRQVDGITHTLAANISQWNKLLNSESQPPGRVGSVCDKERLC